MITPADKPLRSTSAEAAAGLPGTPSLRQWAGAWFLSSCTLLWVIVAHVPLLARHVHDLWSRPQYQFIVLLVPAAVLLGIVRSREVPGLQPGHRLIFRGWVFGCCLVLSGAVLLQSPWLGAASAMLTAAAFVYGLGGRPLAGKLAPIGALLLLALPLPLGINGQLAALLQSWTTRSSSALLDLLGVYHGLSGNVIEVGTQRLFVQEACAGLHSFFALVPLTLFYVLWMRRPFAVAVLLVAAAAGWTLAANAGRVVGITLITTQLEIDVTSGWRHELFGALIYLVALGLVWSTDCLLLCAAGMPCEPPATVPGVPAYSDDQELHVPPPDAARASLRRLPPPQRIPPLASVLWGALFALQAALLLGARTAASELALDFPSLESAFPAAGDSAWQPVGFDRQRREHNSEFGEFSQSCQYRFGAHSATLSVDYPFSGWHELSVCYEGQGWQLQDRAAVASLPEQAPEGTFVRARFTKPFGAHAYLWFGLFDAAGNPLRQEVTPVRSLGERFLDRLTRLGAGQTMQNLGEPSASRPETTYQVQLLIRSEFPLTADEEQQAAEFFRQAAQRLPPPRAMRHSISTSP